MKVKLTKIDGLSINYHSNLDNQDKCFFIWEYNVEQDCVPGNIKSLILNLKKSPLREGRPEWRYKGEAISQCAKVLKAILPAVALSEYTFVPVPPSKAKDHAEYDDRLTQIITSIGGVEDVDVRDIVVQNQTTVPFHEPGSVRLSVDELVDLYSIDETVIGDLEPKKIIIFDDILTNGTHFKAMKMVLSERFPNAKIVGVFLARVPPRQ